MLGPFRDVFEHYFLDGAMARKGLSSERAAEGKLYS